MMKSTIVAATAALLMVAASHAAIPPEMLPNLRLKMDLAMGEAINSLMNEERVSKEMFCEWPLTPPQKEIAAIEKEIERTITKEAYAKYPNSNIKLYEREALDKYTIFKVGQKVKLHLKEGGVKEGIIRKFDQKTVLLDAQTIRLANLIEEDLAHFNGQLADSKVQQHIRRKTGILKKNREAYRRSIREKTEHKLYREYGYILVYGKWRPVKEYVEEAIQAHESELRKRLEPLIKLKVYYEQGLVMYSGEWMTKEEAEERRKMEEQLQNGEAPAVQPVEETETPAEAEDDEEDEGGLWD